MTSVPALILTFACSLLGLAVCVRAFRRLPVPAAENSGPFLRDTRAVATIEFALVFPIALFLMLTLAQTTLVMGSLSYVHYAAYSATRAAIVQIPRDLPETDEPANAIYVDLRSPKFAAIRRAAVLSLVPVAGRLAESGTATQTYVAGLSHHFASYGMSDPAWLTNLAADRLRYADAYTRVTLLRTTVPSPQEVEFDELRNGRHTFSPREAISVRVEHELHLAVPYASMLFADDWHETRDGLSRYSLVEAQYTLTNEGVPVPLPPRPSIDRVP